MMDAKQVDLLLIGKTGNGKSAAGNSILRRKAFKSKASTESVTTNVDYEVSEFNGRVIKVVDGPGVGDTRMNTEAAVHLVMNTMEYAIAANPSGYHAFILVVRFGGRFTVEDRDTIEFLKKVFGQDFVKQFCVLVLTCGDNFEHEMEETGNSLQEWCKDQKGIFQDLLKECNYRVAIFDNVTKDQAKKNDQVKKLLTIVDNLSSRGDRYTDENFARAREARERVIVELKKSVIEEETLKETSLILMKIQELQLEEDLQQKIVPLEKLQLRVDNLFDKICSQDRDTGVLHALRSSVKSLQKNISDETKFCFRMMDERKKIRQREEETQRKYEDELKRLKEAHDRELRQEQRVLEEHRKFEKEQERLKMEMEEKNRHEREQSKRKYKVEQEQLKKKNEDLEQEYQRIKAENDRGVISKVVDTVTWPLRSVGGWVYSLF